MQDWLKILSEITEFLTTSSIRWPPYFRGHGDSSWKLLPGLGRSQNAQAKLGLTEAQRESSIYADFVTRGGDLLPSHYTSWDHLFAMQHHGLPTRLLDWTNALSVAIHFAVSEGSGDAAIWVLDPYTLNAKARGAAAIPAPRDLSGTYDEYFLKRSKHLPGDVLALIPVQHQPRIMRQQSGFTLHATLSKPLEEIYPDVVRKFVIPAAIRPQAMIFLQLMGVTEFSLFPDLDALAREIRRSSF